MRGVGLVSAEKEYKNFPGWGGDQMRVTPAQPSWTEAKAKLGNKVFNAKVKEYFRFNTSDIKCKLDPGLKLNYSPKLTLQVAHHPNLPGVVLKQKVLLILIFSVTFCRESVCIRSVSVGAARLGYNSRLSGILKLKRNFSPERRAKSTVL